MVKPNIAAQEAEGTALMPQVTAIAVLTEPEKFEAFYDTIVAETNAFTADLSTALGRAKIAKMARKVAKTKTFLDTTGKTLNDDARKRINAVDASRRAMRERLDNLRDKVRQPLTEWEDREEKRKATVEQKFKWMLEAARWPLDADLQDVEQHRDDLVAFTVRDELFQDRADEAREYLAGAVEAIVVTIERIKKQFEAAVELARLQENEAARLRKADKDDADEQEAARVAMVKETQKLNAEAEEQRLATMRAEAEDRGRQEAEAKHRKAEQERLDAKAEQQMADVREAKEKVRRERNKKHRAEVKLAATIAIATAGQIERAHAGFIVDAIIAGGIPRVRLEF